MRKSKKGIATFLAIATLCIGLTGLETNASNNNASFTGLFDSNTNEAQQYTSEEQQIVDQKIEQAESLSNRPVTRAASKISIPGTFTMYQQETDDYCAPACVKSVIAYNSGTILAQSTIAKGMGTSGGTDVTKIAPYLNTQQDFTYIRSANPTQSSMCSYLYSTVANNDTPAMMTIANSSGANWHYATSGHALVVNAVYSDNSKIQFADPLGGKQSGWPYYYEKSASVANSVCTGVIW